MLKKTLWIVITLITSNWDVVHGQRLEQLHAGVDSVVQNAIEKHAFPGAVIYVLHKDTVLFSKSYGFHTYDSIIAVESGHLYDLASLTKVLAGTVALMKLFEYEMIELDDPIKKYVSGLGRGVGDVTIRHALAHQGGLFPWIPFYEELKRKNGRYKRRFISDTSSPKYDFELGKNLYLRTDFYDHLKGMIAKSEIQDNPSYKYSGLFFYLIPELVKSLSGQDYDDFLREEIYQKNELPSLTFSPLKDYSLEEIAPSEVDTFFRKKVLHGVVHDEGAIFLKGLSANAGLFGDAKDVALLLSAIMNPERDDSFDKHVVQLFTTTQFPNKNNRRGLGFDKPLLSYDSLVSSVAKSASFKSYGHTGFTGTIAWADPEFELVFVMLCNRTYPSRENKAIYKLNVRPTIHQMFYDYVDF